MGQEAAAKENNRVSFLMSSLRTGKIQRQQILTRPARTPFKYNDINTTLSKHFPELSTVFSAYNNGMR